MQGSGWKEGVAAEIAGVLNAPKPELSAFLDGRGEICGLRPGAGEDGKGVRE
jgi:hypothetical protein